MASRRLRRATNLTESTFSRALRRQDIRCDICKEQFLTSRDIKVDHDHETDKARGLLCNRCNLGLGYFRDSPKFLRSAAHYLEKRGDERSIKPPKTPPYYTKHHLCNILKLRGPDLDELVARGELAAPTISVGTEMVWEVRDVGRYFAERRRLERATKMAELMCPA